MHNDLSIDHDAYADHARWLLANGCDGVVLMGTTGEANSFSVSERIELLENLIKNGIPKESLMVGTGCAALTDTVALSRHALECGVQRVLMLPPFYYKDPTDAGLFASFDQVIQRVGDASLRVYLYHFPKMSVVPFSEALISDLRKAYPETVVGLKDSSGDLQHMLRLIREFPGFNVFTGTERYLLEVVNAGGAGCVSATTNITCRLAQSVYQGWKKGDVDLATLSLMKEVRGAIERRALIPTLKWIVAQKRDCPSWENVRPPHLPLGNPETETLSLIAAKAFSHQ